MCLQVSTQGIVHVCTYTSDESLYRTFRRYKVYSPVPRSLPDFISQPWRKVGRTIAMSWSGNGELGWYIMCTQFRNDGSMSMQYAASTASLP